MSKETEPRVFLTTEQAMSVIDPKNHTFMGSGQMLVGAEYSDKAMRELLDNAYSIEVSGWNARRMGHGIMVATKVDDEHVSYVGVATVEDKLAALEDELLNSGRRLDAMPRSKDHKVLIRYSEDFGRMGDLDGMFIASYPEYKQMLDKTCYLGESLGKHSQVTATFTTETLKVVSEDQDFIKKFIDVMGSDAYISGEDVHGIWLDRCADAEAEAAVAK